MDEAAETGTGAGPVLSGTRTGPLREGERIRLTDPKGRHHSVVLTPGHSFHTTKGGVPHDEIIGLPEGSVVTTVGGMELLVVRPLLREYTVSMPREAAVVYPKEAAQIVMACDIFPGARVVEAGVGSGALTLFLLRAIGPSGHLTSWERRAEFAEVAERNVTQFLGERPGNWTVGVGDLAEASLGETDRVVLDMLAPWDVLDNAAAALVPGGVLCAYVATVTQLGRIVETIRAHTGFTEPEATETTTRPWHAEGLAIRPGHATTGHTGFLVVARRLAPGVRAPAKKRRPAPLAYGPDYVGPRPPGVDAG